MNHITSRYFYYRDEVSAPRVTCCALTNNDTKRVEALGIALAINDNPKKELGRFYAFTRARQAYLRQKHLHPIQRPEVFVKLNNLIPMSHNTFYYKAIYKPRLTPSQLAMIGLRGEYT